MANLTDRQLRRLAWLSGAGLVLGFLLYLLTRTPGDIERFWDSYRAGFYGTAIMLMVFGFICLALALVHLHTHFFDPDRNLDANTFSATVAAIVIAGVLLIGILVPRIPATAPSELPTDPEKRAAILRMEGNFKLVVGLAIIVSGIAVGYIPCRRFLQN